MPTPTPPPSTQGTAIPGLLGPDGQLHTYHVKPGPRVWLDGINGALLGYLASSTGHGRVQAGSAPYQRLLGLYAAANCSTKQGSLNAATNEADLTDWPLLCGHMAALLWRCGSVPDCSSGSDPADTVYLPVAKWAVTHVEEMWGGTFGADETTQYGGSAARSDYGRLYLPHIVQTYSILRGSGVLTAAEIQTFSDKMLNGNPLTANGTGGSATDLTAACVNQGAIIASGTISVSGTTATFSADQWDYPNVGGALLSADANVAYGRIVGWTDQRHAVLSKAEPTIASQLFRYSTVWKQDAGGGVGHCGLLWFLFHHVDAIKLFPGQERAWPTNYPPDGGNYSGYADSYPAPADYYTISLPVNNKMFTQIAGYTSVSLALADDDVRARNLLPATLNWYQVHSMPLQLSLMTPLATADATYYTSFRDATLSMMIALMVRNSLVEPDLADGLTQGVHLNRWADYFTYFYRTSNRQGSINTIEDWGGGPGVDEYYQQTAMCMAGLLFPDTVDSAYMTALARTVMGYNNQANHSGAWPGYDFVFCDPAQTQAVLANAPKQFMFGATDLKVCQSNAAWSAQCTPNAGRQFFASRQGWGPTDTLLTGTSGYNALLADHGDLTDWGHYQITKGGESLLFYNTAQDAGSYITGRLANTVELSGLNWGSVPGSATAFQGYAALSRWAGTNPTGDAGNRYAYVMMDLLPAGTLGVYTASAHAARVQRHIVHFKDSSEFIVEYTDVAVTQGETINAYYHYALSGVGTWSDATIAPVSRTASVVHGTAARLNSQFLSADGDPTHLALVVDSADGSFPNGNSTTARATLTASSDGSTRNQTATSMESIAVHQPCASVACTMPPVTQPRAISTGGLTTCVQIADTTKPAVACFSRQDALLSDLSVTTTHAGTAQYVLAGMASGMYTVTVGGAAVGGAPFTVVDGDGTIRFDSIAGAVVVGRQ